MSKKEGSGEESLSFAQRAALLEGIANLPEPHARVIALHYLQGEPLRDIAKKLKISLKMVHKLHFDSLKRLNLWVD